MRPTRGLAMYGIAVLVSWGDSSRTEAIRWLRQMFLDVQEMNDTFTTTYWGLAVGRIALSELKHELKWILKSESLSQNYREVLLKHMERDTIEAFLPEMVYCRAGHLFQKMFPKEIRGGECGYLVKPPLPDVKTPAPAQADSNQSPRMDEQRA